MQGFFQFLADNPYILLFLTVGLAVLVGKFSVKGYGLGMVAAAVVVGAALATWASTYGVKLQLDNFAKSLFYYLFMYGVGLRVGPAFFNSLKKDGIKFTTLAVICAVLGLALVVLTSKWFGLPAGAAGGVLAGSQTMSAAIGTAEMAVEQGAYKLPPGTTAEQVSGMIALGYGVTYIWGTIGIILVCKYLPRWWGIDARKSAKEYEAANGVQNVDDIGLTGYRAVAQDLSAVPHRERGARRDLARRGFGRRAQAGRRGRTRWAPGRPHRQPRIARDGSRRCRRAEHPARPGRSAGDQQGTRRPPAEVLRAGRVRRPGRHQPDRTQWRAAAAGHRHNDQAPG